MVKIKKNNQHICKIDEYGNKWWLFNSQLHREDGPAIEYTDGTKYWYLHGQQHRIDGPAYEDVNGTKFWWYYGEEIRCSSQEEFNRLLKLKALW